jgi:hypothetical protein
MNERIRELAEQATFRQFFMPKSNSVSALDKFNGTFTEQEAIEKFAELIVKECLSQVDKVDAILEDDKEKTGVAWVGLAIAKHFGVEE